MADAGTAVRKSPRGKAAPDAAGRVVVFFDQDDTLIDVNSGWLWVRHEVALGRISVVRLPPFLWHTSGSCTFGSCYLSPSSLPSHPPCVQGLVLRAVYYMIIYALGWVKNVDSAYKTAVSTYAGIPVATIRSQTQKWFKEEVLPRTRPLARTVLERHRKQGDLCVLASSTTQFAAECAVTAYGLDDTVSSVLEVDANGALTGNVEKLAFGRSKLIRVREWAAARNVDLSRAWFYSDSIADAPLLAEVGNPVCVNPDRRLRRLARHKGWPVVDWGHSPAPLIKRVSSSNLIGQDKSAS